MTLYSLPSSFFFFNDTATTEIYTLSLHDALPISFVRRSGEVISTSCDEETRSGTASDGRLLRSEEHTSELRSQSNLVCRLLLEKKKKDPIADQLLSSAMSNAFEWPNQP